MPFDSFKPPYSCTKKCVKQTTSPAHIELLICKTAKC